MKHSLRSLQILILMALMTAYAGCSSGHRIETADTPAPTVAHATHPAGFALSVREESNIDGGAAAGYNLTVQERGQDVIVAVNAESARGLKALIIELGYDPERFHPLSAEPTDIMGAPADLLTLTHLAERGQVHHGQVLINYQDRPGVSGDGTLARIMFSRGPAPVLRQAKTPPTHVTSISFANFDDASETLSWDYASRGDYDQNSEVNAADLVPIAGNFLESSAPAAAFARDSALSVIDGDENTEINAADIVPIAGGFLNTVESYNIYAADDSADYTASASAPSTIAPLDNVLFVAATASFDERKQFSYAAPQPLSSFYWVRPVDRQGIEGIASTLTAAGPPIVTATTPGDNAQGVALDIRPSATFSHLMDAETISEATFTLHRGATPVAGSVTYSGVTATFTPADDLASDGSYTATITTGAENLSGIGLAGDHIWSFETAAGGDVTAPTVSSTAPQDGNANIPLNTIATATFSEAMDPLTIDTDSFTLHDGVNPVAGSVTYAGLTATFNPAEDLDPDTQYTATITTSATDLAGNPLAGDHSWSFETGAAKDDTAPTVSSTTPLNGDVNIPLNTTATATFSEAMDPLTIDTNSFTLREGVNPVAGSVSYTGQTATFDPADDLDADTQYTATITTSATDLAGNPLASDHSWTFRTTIVDLGAGTPFGSFGGGSGMTNQGIFTVINGDIGTTGASTMITGFHDSDGDVYTETPLNQGQVNGQIYTAPPAPGTAEQLAIATQAANDVQNAYDEMSPDSLLGGTDPGAGQLGGLTLPPAVYKSAGGTFEITGSDLTLDAQGDPNAIWIFQAPSSLTVGDTVPRSVILVNGAQARNVYWWVGSAATINGAGGGTMVGTIIASAGVTFSTAGNVVLTVLNGRAIGLNASVTLVNTQINIPE